MAAPPTVAAIDIGSNSIKMTLGRPDGQDGVVEFGWASETVRLGTGLDQAGRLADDRMDAALATLRRFADEARAQGASRIVAVATEATRAAANGEAFLRRVRDETGIEVRAITGDTETDLTFRGLAATVDLSGAVVVADVGGGSTELIPARDGVRLGGGSLPIGSGRLTERLVAHDPPTTSELAACRAAAAAVIVPHPELVRVPGPRPRLVATGGTGEYLAELVGWQPFSSGDAERVLDQLTRIAAVDLAPRIGAAEARARVLPAGIATVLAVADASGAEQIATAASGIRTGLLLDALVTGQRGEHDRG